MYHPSSRLPYPIWSAEVANTAEEARFASTLIAVVDKAEDGSVREWALYAKRVDDDQDVATSRGFPVKVPYEVATALYPRFPKERYRS